MLYYLCTQAGATTLVFVQRLAEPYDASSIGPGWHYYLDRLDAVVAGPLGIGEPVQRIERRVGGRDPCRVLLGLLYVVFGSNAFLQFMPMPEMTGQHGEFIGSMAATRYIQASRRSRSSVAQCCSRFRSGVIAKHSLPCSAAGLA